MVPEQRSPSAEFHVPYDYLSPYLDGVYLAINALPGTYLVHDAHDCGTHKASKIAGGHDLGSDLLRWDGLHRIARTGLDSREYVMGSDDKLSMKLAQVVERHHPDAVFVVRSSVVVFAGHDARPVVQDAARKTDVPIILLPDRSVARDYLSGYFDTVESLLGRVRLDGSGERGVALAGYVFDRNEGDHHGNLAELERMVQALGLPLGPVFLGGQRYAALNAAAPPAVVVDLAEPWSGATKLAARFGAAHCPLGLPLGIDATEAWLRGLAAAVGGEALAEGFIDRELSALVPELEWIVPRAFQGRGVLPFADRLLLPPLTAMLEELDWNVVARGLTSGDYSGVPGSAASCEPGPAEPPRFTDELLDFVADHRRRGELSLVIGNSFLHRLLLPVGVPFVEFGFPSVTHHVLHPAPFLGFHGVRVWVERMLEALEIDALRPQVPTGKHHQ
jgi:nitrogenase molybdenum-iron protein alpha/beta subunit